MCITLLSYINVHYFLNFLHIVPLPLQIYMYTFCCTRTTTEGGGGGGKRLFENLRNDPVMPGRLHAVSVWPAGCFFMCGKKKPASAQSGE